MNRVHKFAVNYPSTITSLKEVKLSLITFLQLIPFFCEKDRLTIQSKRKEAIPPTIILGVAVLLIIQNSGKKS